MQKVWLTWSLERRILWATETHAKMLHKCVGANEWRDNFGKQFIAEGKDKFKKNLVCFTKNVKCFIEIQQRCLF